MRRDRWGAGAVVILTCAAVAYWRYEERDMKEHFPVTAVATSDPAVRASAQDSSIRPPRPMPLSTAVRSAEPAFAEDAVIVQIRDTVINDPRFAEELAVEDQKHFPDSPNADERDALLVAAVFNQGQMDRARIEARRYFKLHPGGRYTDYVIRETGAHP